MTVVVACKVPSVRDDRKKKKRARRFYNDTVGGATNIKSGEGKFERARNSSSSPGPIIFSLTISFPAIARQTTRVIRLTAESVAAADNPLSPPETGE